MSENVFTAPRKSQLHRELMGVLSLSSFDAHNSASRKQMFSSHIGQTLVIKGATRRRIQTGMEQEYGKYTFNVKAPANITVLKVVHRYPRTLGSGSIKHNPETLVIYEIDETRQIGCMSLTDYYSNHSYFGFKYARSKKVHELRPGGAIAEGTILQDSPAIAPDGDYMYGAECNVAFMSHPAVSEDGILISRDVLDRFSFKTYETRVVEWGSNFYPLNLYGDANNYRPHPDIGDPVREDGLLMALRSHEEGFSPAEMSINSTQNVNPIFDHMVYAGGPGGRVIDIRVMHDPESAVPTTPVGMENHTRKYDIQRHNFYQEIVNEYTRLKKDRGEALRLTEEFHRLVVEAISVVGMPKGKGKGKEEGGSGDRVTKLYRNAPLDDWRVEIVIEYDVTPTIGFKLTDCHGGN
jgi:hypothetical protein